MTTIKTERLVCRWCPRAKTRFLDGTKEPTNPYFIMRSHIREEHPEEHRRIEDYLSREVIVQEEAVDGVTVAKER